MSEYFSRITVDRVVDLPEVRTDDPANHVYLAYVTETEADYIWDNENNQWVQINVSTEVSGERIEPPRLVCPECGHRII